MLRNIDIPSRDHKLTIRFRAWKILIPILRIVRTARIGVVARCQSESSLD